MFTWNHFTKGRSRRLLFSGLYRDLRFEKHTDEVRIPDTNRNRLVHGECRAAKDLHSEASSLQGEKESEGFAFRG